MSRTIDDLQTFAEQARVFLLDYNLVIDDNIQVVLNNRLSRALGRCLYKNVEIDGMYHKIPFKVEIQTHYFLSDTITDHDIVQVLIHEFLHTLFPYDGHEGKWKKYANFISSSSQYTITRYTATPDNFDSKMKQRHYGLYCPHCQKVIQYYKVMSYAVRHPDLYVHTSCKTKLTAINLDEFNTKDSDQNQEPVHPQQLSLF